jgi:hypothetical protein
MRRALEEFHLRPPSASAVRQPHFTKNKVGLDLGKEVKVGLQPNGHRLEPVGGFRQPPSLITSVSSLGWTFAGKVYQPLFWEQTCRMSSRK